MFEKGQVVKIVYQDANYSKIAFGKIIDIDENMIYVDDRKYGQIGVGRKTVISIMAAQEGNNDKFSQQ